MGAKADSQRGAVETKLRNWGSVGRQWGFQDSDSGEELTCKCRGHKRHEFDPRVGKLPWRRKWQVAAFASQ